MTANGGNSLMNEREEEILRGCLRGEAIYQKRLYDLFASKMYAVCLRYSSDKDEARDLLQEGFIKVFQHLDKFKMEGSLEGWIRRIMVNHALEQFRKAYKKQQFVDIEDAGDEPTPHIDAHRYDMQVILNVIQELPTGYRTVFNLYVVEGLQHNEIAELMGINENTSKSQLSRARQLLQKKLAHIKAELNG